MHRGATAWANCKLIGVYVVHVGPHPTGTHYQVELVSAELRHLVKAVGWGWVFFLSRLRRADSKLFALLLRTLATESNLTLLNRAGRRLPRRQCGPSQDQTGPGAQPRRGLLVRGIAVRGKASRFVCVASIMTQAMRKSDLSEQ